MRKLDMLERRSQQKAMTNLFYRQEIGRRRGKYEREVLEARDRYDGEVGVVEGQVVEEMRAERVMDEENSRLGEVLAELQ